WGATADAGQPAAFGPVAVDHRPPAADLDQALRRAVLMGEIALFVIARSVTAFMHRLAEEPRRTQSFVERDHRRQAGRLIKQVERGLHKVVRLHRTSRYVDNRDIGG